MSNVARSDGKRTGFRQVQQSHEINVGEVDQKGRIEITGEGDQRARIDVRLEDGRHWLFAVADGVAGLVMTLEDGQRVDDDLPSWLEPLLQRFGLEGVEK